MCENWSRHLNIFTCYSVDLASWKKAWETSFSTECLSLALKHHSNTCEKWSLKLNIYPMSFISFDWMKNVRNGMADYFSLFEKILCICFSCST